MLKGVTTVFYNFHMTLVVICEWEWCRLHMHETKGTRHLPLMTVPESRSEKGTLGMSGYMKVSGMYPSYLVNSSYHCCHRKFIVMRLL